MRIDVRKLLAPLACALLACALLLSACSSGGGGGAAGGTAAPTERELIDAEARGLEDKPGQERPVEEPDLLKLDGGFLYVQSRTGGLSVIDVSDPQSPRVTATLPTLTGEAGELFIRQGVALVVFKESVPACAPTAGTVGAALPAARAQVTSVVAPASAPAAADSVCVPGRLLASRLLGDRLILVTVAEVAAGASTHLFAVDVTDPANLAVMDELVLAGRGHEVHVTDRAAYVAQSLDGDPLHGTELRYVDLAGVQDPLVLRGSIRLAGAPQGRFHMDEAGTMFRLVTFEGRARGSDVHLIDVVDPDQPALVASLTGIGPGEELRAARFVGNRCYIVTFEPIVVVGRTLFADPLWVVSLDPTDLRTVGQLDVPGWSDYIFPRGNRLVAVGRSDYGEQVAASLFDVQDPAHPRELTRLIFGGAAQSTSIANSDYRGVRIVEAGALGPTPLLVLPYSDQVRDPSGACAPTHFIQLVDLDPDALLERGRAQHTGRVLRTVPIGGKLYAISGKTVTALDVAQRDLPFGTGTVVVGDVGAAEDCEPAFVETPVRVRGSGGSGGGGCALGIAPGAAGARIAPPPWLLIALAAGLALCRRHRSHPRPRPRGAHPPA